MRPASAHIGPVEGAPVSRLPSQASHPEPSFAKFWQALQKERRLLVKSTLAAVVIAMAYCALATPQFTSSTLLMIDTKNTIGMKNGPALADANVEAANIEGQVEVLKSERLLQQVVEDQNLLNDRALAPSAIESILSSLKSKIMFWKKPDPFDVSMQARLIGAARATQKLVDAKRVGATYAIEVSTTFPRAEQAAAVANALARLYIEDQQHFREDLARRQSGLLQQRSDELQAKVRQAEQAVEELKFSGSVKDENSASARVILRNLESTAQTYRVLHDKFLEQAAESYQQQFISMPDAQVVSPAYPPLTKSAPKTLIIVAGAFFAGLFAGICIVLVRDSKEIGFG